MNMNINVSHYKGPMDILLELIKKNEIDIYDIPILTITEQYLEYIKTMQYYNLELSSEFILMAATLIEIKSKMLLPQNNQQEDDIEDPRSTLVEQLIEYQFYKDAAEKMQELNDIYNKVQYKVKDEYYLSNSIELITDDNPLVLYNAYARILSKLKIKKVTFEDNIEREQYSVEECKEYILNAFNNHKSIPFETIIFSYDYNKVICTFLALLELVKIDVICVSQHNNFDTIILTKKE